MTPILTTMTMPFAETRPALRRTAMEGRLDTTLLHMAVTQTWVNDTEDDMEAVYTLPLPVDAVILSVEARIGERRFQGQVVDRQAAEDGYEDAIGEGDSAALVRPVAPGLYHLSLGNLRPGEQAEIRYTYADLPSWHGDRLRLALPTTLAPRYGDPRAYGLAPHETPEADPGVVHPLAFCLRVRGPLARARATSPTHPLLLDREGDELLLSLTQDAAMDRDLVVDLRLPGREHDFLQVARDKDGYVALATLHPHLPATDASPRNLKIVVDCSGSMAGDSINQARAGLRAILDALEPRDHFNLIRFGSTVEPLFPHQVPARQPWLDRARALVETLDADLGGTELGAALEHAFASTGGEGPGEILLVTDGEVWLGDLAPRARRHDQRIFPVGLGAAAASDVLTTLARESGGEAEFVTPNEDLAAAIQRQFHRLRSPRARARVRWPGQPRQALPETLARVYDGDTRHLIAWYDTPPQGSLSVELAIEGGPTQRLRLPLPEPTKEGDTLARIAAHRRLATLEETDPEAARELALRYQLLSPHTALLLTLQRQGADKAGTLPRLHREPHMLAAGWGGYGSVRREATFHAHHSAFHELEMYVRRRAPWHERMKMQLPRILALLDRQPEHRPLSLSDLPVAILPQAVQDALQDLIDAGEPEAAVAGACLWALLLTPAGRVIDRDLRRRLLQRAKRQGANPELRDRILALLQSQYEAVP